MRNSVLLSTLKASFGDIEEDDFGGGVNLGTQYELRNLSIQYSVQSTIPP